MKQLGVASGITEEEQKHKHVHAIQHKLEHLVAVHRQLHRRFATSDLNAKEPKRRVAVREERIKKLEASNRNITESLRNQVEKHVEELIHRRDPISNFRRAKSAPFECHGNIESTSFKTLRGGGAEAPLYHMDRPIHIPPIHEGSLSSSSSSTSEGSISEIGQQRDDPTRASESFFSRLYRSSMVFWRV